MTSMQECAGLEPVSVWPVPEPVWLEWEPVAFVRAPRASHASMDTCCRHAAWTSTAPWGWMWRDASRVECPGTVAFACAFQSWAAASTQRFQAEVRLSDGEPSCELVQMRPELGGIDRCDRSEKRRNVVLSGKILSRCVGGVACVSSAWGGAQCVVVVPKVGVSIPYCTVRYPFANGTRWLSAASGQSSGQHVATCASDVVAAAAGIPVFAQPTHQTLHGLSTQLRALERPKRSE